MTGIQKVIKYLAIAFAIFLTFNIIFGIMYGISSIGILFDNNKSNISDNQNNLEINNNTLLLDINVSSSNIIIKKGDNFIAQTSSKYINCKQDNNKLYIIEKKHNWFNTNKNNELIIYVPSDFTFDRVIIDAGAGKVNIEELSTKELYLSFGAGKAEINNLEVLENAEIEGGAGDLIIDAININNLELNMGIGKLSLTSKLTGKNKIDSGIGEINLSLLGTEEDYEIYMDKGLGKATINGNNVKDDNTYGNGINKIDINGGIGNIEINFKNSKD